MDEYTVKDSSLWQDVKTINLHSAKESSIRLGVVQSEQFDKTLQETVYVVEVSTTRGYIPVLCRKSERFGGAFNYEEYSHQTFQQEQDPMANRDFQACPGDLVLVAYINGLKNFGVIVGALRHRARQEKVSKKSGYYSEFNGIETVINDKGEWTLTYKGLPKNIKTLNSSSRSKLPPPSYDTDVGSGYMKWDTTGSLTISDNSKKGDQTIKIDKPNGKITIKSGNTILTIDKNSESYEIKNKSTKFNSSDLFEINTKTMNVNASDSYNLKSAKINTEGEFTQKGNTSIKGNTKIDGNVDINGNTTNKGNASITGNLETKGKVDLAGGMYPLVYDVIMSIGPGNLGCPVISSVIVLKTTMTKAS